MTAVTEGRNVTLAMPEPVTADRPCPKCGGYGSGTGVHATHRTTCEDYRPVARNGRVYCPRCLRHVPVEAGAVGDHSHVMAPGTPCAGIGWECAS